jgi:hypothetical protein
MANRVILIVPDGADSLLQLLDQYMQEWVTANGSASHTPPVDNDGAPTDRLEDDAEVWVTSQPSGSSTPPSYHAGGKSPASSSVAPGLQAVSDVLRRLSLGGVPVPTEAPIATAIEHKHRPLNTQDLPFELHAFEALLTTVMALETQEFNRVNAQVQSVLGYFRTGSLLPIEVQERMRNRKNELLVMLRRISSARSAINELTEDDEDMALMSLSVLRAKPLLYR